MKLLLISIGRPKSQAIRELAALYAKRISHYLPFEITVCRDDIHALEKIEKNDYLTVLDEHGKEISSRELAKFISMHQMKSTRRIVFFIGGEDGIGAQIKSRANILISISKMTLPHELAQVVILEQIYRACSINRGEPYHRD